MSNDKTLADVQKMYDHFYAEAEEVPDSTDGERIWRGAATKTYKAIPDFNPANYTRHRNLLVACGSVEVVKQGARHAESRWLLRTRPTQDLLDGSDSVILKEKHRKESEVVTVLKTRVKVLERQMGGLSLVDALREFDERLRALEAQIGEGSN